MTLLQKICNELGVNVGKVWTGDDGKFYSIESNGQLLNHAYKTGGRKSYTDSIEKILTGQLKPMWKPRDHELYYTISFFEEGLCEQLEWGDRRWERRLLEMGLVFNTKEEAITAANKALDILKEEEDVR